MQQLNKIWVCSKGHSCRIAELCWLHVYSGPINSQLAVAGVEKNIAVGMTQVLGDMKLALSGDAGCVQLVQCLSILRMASSDDAAETKEYF